MNYNRGSMSNEDQVRKARDFHKLHHDPKLLILPNVWDPLGSRLLEGLGYPAVATASAAVAYSLGYDDGQKISFAAMLDVIRRIASSVHVPVTADVEAGYAEKPEDVAGNMRQVIHAGAVGINLEDSVSDEHRLYDVEMQCARIRAVREMAEREGIPLFINARVDTFILGVPERMEERIKETINRAKAYLSAGASGIYPIVVSDLSTLRMILKEIQAPINVYASVKTPAIRDLEQAGISRLSLGPGLLRASFTTMKRIAEDLLQQGTYDAFTRDAVSSDEIVSYLSRDRMPD